MPDALPLADLSLRQRAALVVAARLLGASHRRLAELFGGGSQAAGAELLHEAEFMLGLPPGATDDDALIVAFGGLTDALGWSPGDL